MYAGSGSDGKVFRFGPDGKAALFFDAERSCRSTRSRAGPRELASTSGPLPTARSIKVEPSGTFRVVFDPDERYIWALATDSRWKPAGRHG